jgi:ATP-dependent 26S proteasome regulatory subunit
VLIAATNEPGFLDAALMRRFDDVAEFGLPGEEAISRLLKIVTASYDLKPDDLDDLARECVGMSFADVHRAVIDAVKAMVLDQRKKLRLSDVRKAILEFRDKRPLGT